jgi:dTDP-glucose pyrophosphorylase
MSKSWKSAILPIQSSIKDVAQNLELSGMKIVLVLDESSSFLGTVSDGDLRRGLINGLDFTTSISKIMNKDSITVGPGMHKDKVLEIMHQHSIFQIPILNDQMKVIGLHSIENLLIPSVKKNLFIVMAGGKGTRLLPYTQNYPKPMLNVRGKPILETIIEKAKAEGFVEFIFVIQHLGEIIEDYFGDGKNFGVSINYIKEKSPLGTLGGLSLLNSLPEAPFVLTNGDVITNVKYAELLDFHLSNTGEATIALRKQSEKNAYGVVKTNGIKVVGIEEKPVTDKFINAGVYVLNPSLLKLLTYGQKIDMTDLFELMLNNHKPINGYPIYENWLDVGNPTDLLKAEELT